MPTEKNIPPFDSFVHEHQVTEKRVDMKDPILSGDVFNPARGKDRITCEQYDTHTWAPGASGTRCSGEGPGRAGPVNSETAARVPSKLA